MHYFDNAATTRLDPAAFEEMKIYLLEEYGNASQPYSFSRKSKKALLEARKIVANCINAEPDEIFFTSGGSESDNWAIKGFIESTNGKNHKAIVTSEFEHHAILNACTSASLMGASVVYVKPTNDGYIVPNILEPHLQEGGGLVSIMLVNNEIGTVQPRKDLCDLAHEKGYVFHTDAVQAVGHMKIDVKQLGVDMLSASAHKFNGPKGVGFLYIKKGTSISSLINGGSQENGLRAGTENIASIVAMAIALKNNVDNVDKNSDYITHLEKLLMNKISTCSMEYVRNGGDIRIPGNISLSFKGLSGETLLHRLDLRGCIVSTGSACDGRNDQISHVLRSISLNSEYAYGTIRISLSKDNTEEDISILADSLINVIKQSEEC